jgi:hypothetical protein
MHAVLHTARVEQRTGAFITLKAGDLLATDELADMARRRDLNVHQVDPAIG